ncbi:MAG: SRPBCC family protein [Sphaerobacteraceae bacterium]|nr:MAG: SRPBCC family protein [Sphaerobacteraceae bacterium]
MIHVSAIGTIKTSREAVWRHLTRVSDWYRWYPGLHGTDADRAITVEGMSWRATGQMGRMLYRGDHQVVEYAMLSHIKIDSVRKPWLSAVQTRMSLEPDGPNSQLRVEFSATPGFWLPGRFLLTGTMHRRLQTEADEVVERLSRYVERSMPYH